MNYLLEILVGDNEWLPSVDDPSSKWMPADLVFATESEAKAAGSDFRDIGSDFRVAETTVEPNARYHAWAGVVTIAEAAELDTPR